MNSFSRRDFLKLSGLGLAGLLAPPLNFHFDKDDPFDAQQGRVTTRMVWMYNRPSLDADKVKICYRDMLLSIWNTAISDDATATNRVWYQIGKANKTEGFVYSGNIQPVRTILNTPYTGDVPEDGLLAEVRVPYTDAYEQADKNSKLGYRIYYETTHWIKAVVTGVDGKTWYQIRDDKWDKLYFVPAEHLHIFSADELAPITPEVTNKKIVVKLDSQLVMAYENDKPVYVVPVSTGGIFSVGTYTTPQGNFLTYYKRPSRHMAAGDLASSGFDLPGVPWVQYITEGGVSFHGTFWHNDFGRPRSHGCINLSMTAAKWLYRWTAPEVPMDKEYEYGYIGTKVEITL